MTITGTAGLGPHGTATVDLPGSQGRAQVVVVADASGDIGASAGASTIGQRTTGFTATTSTTVLTADSTRVGYLARNDSNVDLYLRRGAAAVSTSNYSVKVPAGGTLWWDDTWKGEVRALLSGTPTGDVTIEELLP